METIIGLLFIILPFIFKLIGKNLEQAGQTDQAKRLKELVQINDSDDDSEKESDMDVLMQMLKPMLEAKEMAKPKPEPEVNPEPQPEVKREPVVQKAAVPKYVSAEGQTAIRKPKQVRKPILVEEEQKKKEKIDPKKLVVYSEIMKPKYTEY